MKTNTKIEKPTNPVISAASANINLVQGAWIKWKNELFKYSPGFRGRKGKSLYLGHQIYSGIIVKDSYGSTGQHTFSIILDRVPARVYEDKALSVFDDHKKYKKGMRILKKGRNLYPNLIEVIYPNDFEKQAEQKELRAPKKEYHDKFIESENERDESENERDFCLWRRWENRWDWD